MADVAEQLGLVCWADRDKYLMGWMSSMHPSLILVLVLWYRLVRTEHGYQQSGGQSAVSVQRISLAELGNLDLARVGASG